MYRKLLIILFLAALTIPLSASAGWFWNKKPAKTVPAPSATSAPTVSSATISELNEIDKKIVDAKYKIWADSFEKENVELVIANQDKFFFTVPELNYLFNSEAKKYKKPFLTDFNLTINQDGFNIAANFQQIIKGRFSFNAKVVKENNKARLSISKVRLYGFPVPSSWLSNPLNKEIDKYFTFLYADNRYDGFSFTNNNGVLKLKPEFK